MDSSVPKPLKALHLFPFIARQGTLPITKEYEILRNAEKLNQAVVRRQEIDMEYDFLLSKSNLTKDDLTKWIDNLTIYLESKNL